MGVPVLLAQDPILQFFDNQGHPAVGGTVLTQVGGLNYPTYSDSAGTIPLPNPIPLNSRGEISTAAGASSQLFLATGAIYTFTLFDKDGNQLNQALYVTNGAPTNFNVGTVSYVANVAALLAITTPFPAYVSMLGYTTPGDGGGGDFYYDPASTATVDNGSVFKPTSVSGAGRYLLKPSLTLFAAQFGILADSTPTVNGTDNSPQLTNLVKYLATTDGLTLEWPKGGVIGYTVQHVFRGFKNLKMICPSPFRNIAPSAPANALGMYFGSDAFINRLVGSPTEIGRQLPYPIATVMAGSASVTLLTPAAASAFTVGGWVMVTGYDQQGTGYPVNLRFFEFRKCVSTNVSTGVIVIDKPLDDSYYSTWYSYVESGYTTGGGLVNTVGPAGIVPFDRGVNANMIENLDVDGLTLLTNPTDAIAATINGENYYQSSLVQINGVMQARFKDLRSTQIFTGSCYNVILDNPSTVVFQLDKEQDTQIINGGVITNLNAATGVNKVECNGTVFKQTAGISPKNQIYRHCKFPSLSDLPIGLDIGRYYQTFVVEDCIFYYALQESILHGLPLTEDAGHPDRPGTLSLTALASPAPTASTFEVSDLSVRISAGIGTTLTRPSDNAKFTITNIEVDGSNLKVSYASDAAVAASDILYYYNIREMRCTGNVRLGKYQRLPWQDFKRWAQLYINTEDGIGAEIIDIPIREVVPGGGNNYYDIDGVTRSIEVVVTKAYTGAGDGSLSILGGTPFGNTWNTTIIDTKTIGQRIILPVASLNSVGADSLQNLGYGRYIGVINVRPLAADNKGDIGASYYVRVNATRR